MTYLCQGKVGGCHLGPGLLQLPSCSQETQVQGVHRGHRGVQGIYRCASQVEVRWHQEEDYASTEIPCPSYTRGAFTKKFSKLFGVDT